MWAAVYAELMLYLCRSKDRSVSFSRLSPEESHRFRRAVYRIWTMHQILKLNSIDGYDYKSCFAALVGFLAPFADAELSEIERAMAFLRDVHRWLSCANDAYMGPNVSFEDHGESRSGEQLLCK